MKAWLENRWTYLSVVLALLFPLEPHMAGRTSFDERPAAPTNWPQSALDLLLEEGRRQLDAQERLLESVRTRAQWLFTTSVALLVVLMGSLGPVTFRRPTLADTFLTIGLFATAYAVLGAGGLIVVATRLAHPDLQYLSHLDPSDHPIPVQLVEDQLTAIRFGDVNLESRLTMLYEVAFWILIGAVSAGLLFATT